MGSLTWIWPMVLRNEMVEARLFWNTAWCILLSNVQATISSLGKHTKRSRIFLSRVSLSQAIPPRICFLTDSFWKVFKLSRTWHPQTHLLTSQHLSPYRVLFPNSLVKHTLTLYEWPINSRKPSYSQHPYSHADCTMHNFHFKMVEHEQPRAVSLHPNQTQLAHLPPRRLL